MINSVVLVGRLTKDADLRYTSGGTAVANFTLAISRTYSNQQGERETDFVNCVVWRKTAENLAQFVGKGSLIGIDGRLQTRSYDNSEGKRVYVTEVVAESVQFLESKQARERRTDSLRQESSNQDHSHRPTEISEPQGNLEPIDISDDDLPF